MIEYKDHDLTLDEFREFCSGIAEISVKIIKRFCSFTGSWERFL